MRNKLAIAITTLSLGISTVVYGIGYHQEQPVINSVITPQPAALTVNTGVPSIADSMPSQTTTTLTASCITSINGTACPSPRLPPKGWSCRNNCNQVELFIYNQSSAEVVALDNKLMEVWAVLESDKNTSNHPLTQSRDSWVALRDQLGMLFINLNQTKELDIWLKNQYTERLQLVKSSGLIK